MLSTRYAMDRRAAALAVKARQVQDGNWMGATLTGGDGSVPDQLRREIAPGPQDAGAGPGAHPLEIMRDLQVRQVNDVITAPLPGPEGWAALELPLPGAPGDGHTHVLKTGAPTPGHSAAEGAVCADDPDEADPAERHRLRIQHQADPCAEPADIPEVDVAELGKRYSQAFDAPAGYPQPHRMDPEEFRRPPVTSGHAAYSPGYASPGRPVPVPDSALAPGMASRQLPADGRAARYAPGMAGR